MLTKELISFHQRYDLIKLEFYTEEEFSQMKINNFLLSF